MLLSIMMIANFCARPERNYQGMMTPGGEHLLSGRRVLNVLNVYFLQKRHILSKIMTKPRWRTPSQWTERKGEQTSPQRVSQSTSWPGCPTQNGDKLCIFVLSEIFGCG